MATEAAATRQAQVAGVPPRPGPVTGLFRSIKGRLATPDVKWKCAKVLFTTVNLEYRGMMDLPQDGQQG